MWQGLLGPLASTRCCSMPNIAAALTNLRVCPPVPPKVHYIGGVLDTVALWLSTSNGFIAWALLAARPPLFLALPAQIFVLARITAGNMCQAPVGAWAGRSRVLACCTRRLPCTLTDGCTACQDELLVHGMSGRAAGAWHVRTSCCCCHQLNPTLNTCRRPPTAADPAAPYHAAARRCDGRGAACNTTGRLLSAPLTSPGCLPQAVVPPGCTRLPLPCLSAGLASLPAHCRAERDHHILSHLPCIFGLRPLQLMIPTSECMDVNALAVS